MEAIDAACEQNISRLEINENTKQTNNILIEHLDLIEKDLAFYEKVSKLLSLSKLSYEFRRCQSISTTACCCNNITNIFPSQVSLLFLLCGHEQIRSKVILQQFITGSFNKSTPTNHLTAWANEHPNEAWRATLLEGLCIIQGKCVIRKMELHWNDLEQQYLSANVQLSLFIHPIIKLLYHVCENLTKDEAVKLIKFITTKYPSKTPLNVNDNGELLELYLLHWMWEGIIDIGDRTSFLSSVETKFNLK